MRISPRIVVQLVADQLVAIDDMTGDEIAFDRDEVLGLMQAITYFAPHLDMVTHRPNDADVEFVELKMPWMQFTMLSEVLDAFVARAPDSSPDVMVRKNAIRSLKFTFKKRNNTEPNG